MKPKSAHLAGLVVVVVVAAVVAPGADTDGGRRRPALERAAIVWSA
jgi:hypothetical protein